MSVDKRDALEHFRLKYQNLCNETDLISMEPEHVIPIKLQPTSAIIVIGYLPRHSTRFSINLICVTRNVAFHFNPRLDRGYIVRNSKVQGSWATEETGSPAAPVTNLFSRNSYFHLVIFCTSEEFYIAVNGQHFCTFSYRLPLHSIRNFEYFGDVEDVRIRNTSFSIYPDPKIMKPIRDHVLTDRQPLTDNIDIPAIISIIPELQYGATIFIKGRLKLLPHSFYVNLQKSKLLYPHPEIALHLNPRFEYENSSSCVVMNSWTSGSWGCEERHDGLLTWMPGREFLLTIRCEYDGYTIWLGSKMVAEFKHRIKPLIVDTVSIYGDVVINELFLSFRD